MLNIWTEVGRVIGGQRKLHNDKLHNLYSSLCIYYQGYGVSRHVAGTGGMIKAY
jgi:hypothetical protein